MSTKESPIPSGKKAIAPDRLLHAALESFASVGYHATTTRSIAERAGMSPAAVYVHYRSKIELLHALSQIGHDSARRCLEEGLSVEGSYADRLSNAVAAFARWHAENQTVARVVQYEYQALPSKYRADIKSVRRRMQNDVEEVIRQGVEAGEFETDDVPGTAIAIISLCIDIARWFNPKGKRSPEELGTLYGELALRMLAADPPRVARRRRTTRAAASR